MRTLLDQLTPGEIFALAAVIVLAPTVVLFRFAQAWERRGLAGKVTVQADGSQPALPADEAASKE